MTQQISLGDVTTGWKFLMIQSADGITGLTGAAFTVKKWNKPGTTTLVNCLGTVTEIGLGLYQYVPDATEVSVAGIGVLHMLATNGNPCDTPVQIGLLNSIMIENNVSAFQALRYIAAACAGQISGMNSLNVNIAGIGSGVPRIAATVDEFGDRTAVALL